MTLPVDHKACFKATDTAGNTSYSASEVGLDTTAPVISLSSVVNNQVSATATDTETSIASFDYQLIASASLCDSGLTSFQAYDGSALDLELDHKACFKATDTAGNTSYSASEAGLDTTAPVISLSSVVNNQVSATATDTETSIASFDYQLITTEACADQLTDFQSYDQSVITLDYDQKACFRAVDTAGNTSYSASEVGLDIVQPVISVSSVTNNQVSASASDTETAIASFDYQLTASTCDANLATSYTAYLASSLLTLPVDHKACFKATDTAGNTSYSASEVGLDTTAPVISLSSVVNNQVSATATDTETSIASFDYQLIASASLCDSDLTSFQAYDGSALDLEIDHKACFKATDTAGNTSYLDSSAGADLTAPIIIISFLRNRVSAVVGDNADPDPSFDYQLITTEACADQLTDFQSYDQSVITLDYDQKACFRAVDTAGNTSYSASEVGLDIVQPVISVSSVTNNQVSASASDTETAIASFEYQLTASTCDANLATSYTAYLASSLLTLPVDHKACFKATDTAGNTSYSASEVGLDTTAPVISLSSVVNNQVSATATDTETSIASFDYQLIASASLCDSGLTSFQAYDGSALDLELDHKACFKATDTAGNTSYSASEVGLDTTAPVISLSSVVNNQVSATATDTETSIASFDYQLITTEACADQLTDFQSYDQSVITLDYDQKACFKATDTAGNTSYLDSTAGQGTTDPDTTSPVISVSSVTDNQVTASASDAETSVASFDYQLITTEACDDQLTDFQSYDQSVITLAYEQMVCFRVTDTAGNTSYSASEAGQDTTAPVISVSSVTDNQVSANASDAETSIASFDYQLMTTDTTCSLTLADFEIYVAGSVLALEVDQKACFRATDAAGNSATAASTPGLDVTAPTISINFDSLTSQVAASVRDDSDPAPSLSYRLMTDNSCNRSLTGFQTYSGLKLELEPAQKACFRAEDSAGNISYKLSPAGTEQATSLPDTSEGASNWPVVIGIVAVVVVGTAIVRRRRSQRSV